MKWAHLKTVITRNWREKLLALGLAFLLWFMIKFQAAYQASVPLPIERPARATGL